MAITARVTGSRRCALAGVVALVAAILPQSTFAQALPSGWQVSNIGAPALAGTATYANGVFAVSGAGAGITGRSDQFTFAFRQLSGDVRLVTRVDSVQGSRALVGVMVRESLAADARHAFLSLDRNGLRALYRPSAGGRTYSSGQLGIRPPVWMRLERRGSRVTVALSQDGTAWYGETSFALSLPQTVYVGFAVTSNDTTSRATASYSNVSDGTTSANQPPAVSMTAPAGGSSYTAPASMVLTANATDSNGVAEVRFYSGSTLLGTDTTEPYSLNWTGVAAGAYTLTVEARDTTGLAATSTPVAVTVSATNRPPTVSITSPVGGAAFTEPASIGVTASAADTDGTIARVEFFSNGALVGSDTTSPYSHTLSNLVRGQYALTAIAHDSAGARTTSAVVTVSVGTNQAPAVSLTSPGTGSSFAAPASITLTANATDDSGVADVRFFAGAQLLGSDTTAPYSFSWAGAAAGNYALTAVARDAAGLTTTSAPVNITVGSTNRPPTVSVTTPTAGAGFAPGATIVLAAAAADTDGTVARVEFYSGSNLVGSDTASPYSVSVASVPAGQYSLTAVAIDNAGARTTSAPVTVSVTANQAPTVSLTSPSNGSTFDAPASINLTANAADGDGTVSQVAFYAGATLLGTDTTSPYAFSWGNIAAGQYAVTAIARDNTGATTVSAAVTVSVGDPSLPDVAAFLPSADDQSLVDRYIVEFFPSTADPAIANPVATQDVGKPPLVNGEYRADVSQAVSSLPAGTYFATVSAAGANGISRSDPSPQFAR